MVMAKGVMRRVKKIVLSVFIVLIFGAFVFCLDRVYPPNLNGKNISTLVTAKDGTPLRAFADSNGVWRYPTTLTQISPFYLEALIGYEDRWFYHHPGVNLFSFIRAAFQNIVSNDIVSGGSTLTMQVVRMLHPIKRNIAGKWVQIFRALQLEWHLTKAQILTLYMNLAPFGSNIEGVQAASFTYLGKPAIELSHAEAVLLAVLPQAPSFYRPDRHPERARKARDKVLDRMEKFDVWPTSTIMEAKKEPVIALRYTTPVTAPLAARRLYFKNKLKNKIVSSLDYDLQIHLEHLVKDYISGFSQDQSGAVLVVNYKTLEVKAYVGSADFTSNSRKGHVDMIQAIRSPGSALKPFLYGLAMDKGLIHSHSLLLDTPRYQQDYDPGNFSNGFTGPVSVAKALRLSLNVPAVQVLEAYGPQNFHDRLVHAGARMKLSGKPNLSMILGGVGTNLESMVRLYTALARDGLSGAPRLLVTDMNGDLPEDLNGDSNDERYLMSPGAAWIIGQILLQPMPGFESINRLAGQAPIAWKTGTSYGFRDAWAFGIMGDYVAGVWVGNPDGSPSPGQYGAITALPLLQRVFESLPLSNFSKPLPSTVQKTKICWPLGARQDQTKKDCHISHDAWILNKNFPMTLVAEKSTFNPLLKTFWVNENNQRSQPSCGGVKKASVAVWPLDAEPWLPKSWRRARLIPPPSSACPNLVQFLGDTIQITSITDNSILSRPPGETSIPTLELNAQGGHGYYHWFLNGRPMRKVSAGQPAFLTMPLPGAHQLAVTDEDGNSDIIDFQVVDRP